MSINYLNKYKKSLYNRRDTPYQLISLLKNKPTDVDEIIFLVTVLSDESNDGYQKLKNLVIAKVNDKKVNSFKEFIELTSSEDYIVLEDQNGLQIVIDGKLSMERDEVIQERYNLNNLYSEDLEKLIK